MLLRAPAAETVGEAMSCAGPLYERLWRPLLLAGLNTDPTEGSAALAAGLMRETLGAGGRACHPLDRGHGGFRGPSSIRRSPFSPRGTARSAWATVCAKFVSRERAPSRSNSTADP